MPSPTFSKPFPSPTGTVRRRLLSKAMLMAVGGLTWAGAAQALTIVPIWDSSITNDPNAAQIESTINGMVSFYDTAFSGTNITLDVNISENPSIGGADNSANSTYESYAATVAAMQSHATTLDNVAVLSKLSPFGNNPVTGTNQGFTMERALAGALGFAVPTNPDGSITTGSIALGLTPGGTFSAVSVAQLFNHEFDEELGTISGVGGSPIVIDLTRYAAPGQRTWTTNPATHAYFSTDGVNMLAEYNQYGRTGGDFGDFAPKAGSLHVQDYYESGAYVPNVELRMLNAVGYGYTGPSISNTFTTNVLNTVTLSTATTAGGVIANVPSNDFKITEAGGSGTLTLASATTIVNTLQNTATATAVTINLAGRQLVAGNGVIDAGTGLIAINAGATSLTVGASANDGTVTAGSSVTAASSGAFTLGLINAGGNASVLDIKSAIVDNSGESSVSIITLNTGTVILEGTNTYTGTTKVGSGSTLQVGNGGTTGQLGSGAVEIDGTLSFNRSGVTSVAGSLSGSGSLIQSGTGTVVLSGDNTAYTGGLTVNAGTLVAATANGSSYGAAGDGGVTVNSGGTISVTTDNGLWGIGQGTTTKSLRINAGGTVTTAGSSGHLSALVMNGGTLSATTARADYGNWDLDGGVSTLGNGSTSSITGGNVVLSQAGGTTFAIGAGDTLNVSSVIDHTPVLSDTGLIKSGSGTLTLSGANTYTGGLTVNAGTLVAATANGSSYGAAGDGGVTVNSGGTISVTTDNGLWGIGQGTTTKSLRINAGGTVTTAGSSGHLSALVMNGGTLSATTARADYGNWDLDGGVSTLGNGSTSSITGGNVVLSQAGGTTFAIGAGDTLNVSSVIDHTPVLSDTGLIKSGSGTLTLTGANTYTGGTTVTAGTLLAGNNAAFGTGTVTVGGTGVVNGGSYTFANTFAVNSGGKLAAGTTTSAGVATFSGGVTLASGSTLVWKITSSTPATAGRDFDQFVESAGTFAIGTGTTLKLTAPGVDYTNAFWTSSHTFIFATASGTGTMTGAFATLDTSAAGNFSADGSWSLLTGAGDAQEAVWTAETQEQVMHQDFQMVPDFQAVPEPSAYGLIGAGALGAAVMVRRRRKNAA